MARRGLGAEATGMASCRTGILPACLSVVLPCALLLACCAASKSKVVRQVNAFCLLHAFCMQNGSSNESFCCKLQWDDSDSAKWSAKAKLKSENDENVRNETCGMQQQLEEQQLEQHLACASTPTLTVSTFKAFKLATAKRTSTWQPHLRLSPPFSGHNIKVKERSFLSAFYG